MALTIKERPELGPSIKEITYSNNAYTLTLMTIGATIKRLKTPDYEGRFENIVVTYEDDRDYLKNTKFLGANVGPYAGRLDPPKVSLNGKTYRLNKNFMGRINLHSGDDNLAFKPFDLRHASEDKAVFSYVLKEDDATFPAPMEFTITYHFKSTGFDIQYDTYAERDAVSNLTNHTYFNLSGGLKDTVMDHTLRIPADAYMALNEATVGVEKKAVDATPFDFRDAKPLKNGILPLKSSPQNGIDHPFFLKEGTIELHDPRTKRVMTLTTDYDCLVVYTNNILTDHRFEGGVVDKEHQAICLEAEHLPNDMHSEKTPKSMLKANTLRSRWIKYRFGTSE